MPINGDDFFTVVFIFASQGAHGDFGERGETGQPGTDVSVLLTENVAGVQSLIKANSC